MAEADESIRKTEIETDFSDPTRTHLEAVVKLMETDRAELVKLSESLELSMAGPATVSADMNARFEKELTFGERLSDKVAAFGGSWAFILTFLGLMALWITLNVTTTRIDPFPFILLNLMLSCVAALQAPVIMMSQNRQEDKDRIRAQHDYEVNLKAELEIRKLHEKVDHLLYRQMQRLLEIQRVQMELLQSSQKSR